MHHLCNLPPVALCRRQQHAHGSGRLDRVPVVLDPIDHTFTCAVLARVHNRRIPAVRSGQGQRIECVRRIRLHLAIRTCLRGRQLTSPALQLTSLQLQTMLR